MRTWVCRHSAKSSTVAISAGFIARSAGSGLFGVSASVPSASRVEGALRSRRSSDGACTSTIRQPPTATPAAAARTPQWSARTSKAAMMPVLYAT